MAEQELHGDAAAPGVALGRARVLAIAVDDDERVPAGAQRDEELAAAVEALERAGAELQRTAERLRSGGRADEAEIVETGILMAADPALVDALRAQVLDEGRPAPAALLAATDGFADLLAGLPDANLAARADDVRSLGRRAARLVGAESEEAAGASPEPEILVAEDLGPADVAELEGDVAAVALAGGGVTAHAAIVARSLGVPMVTGVGPRLLELAAPRTELVVDGAAGTVVIAPGPSRRAQAERAIAAAARARAHIEAARGKPAETLDGRRLAVLANVATRAEVAAAREAGADGVGLLRTELAFLDAPAWPTEAQHRRALEPVLTPLAGRLATVRVLDFGADKTPPFLAGTPERGIALLLGAPDALAAQLRAIVAAGAQTRLRILLPLVGSVAEVEAARALAREAVAAVPGAREPELGAMIETPQAAAIAGELAQHADFLSIGTNDLTAQTLDVDRLRPGEAQPHHPAVLAAIDASARAARAAGIPIEVCGEASSDPRLLPLLVGVGIDEVSVGAARVGLVRAWIRELRADQVRALAEQALEAASAEAVASLLAPTAERLALLERGDASGEGLDGGGGVLAVGPEP